MANKKCPKCGSDLALREGYGVCNSCGEIVAAAEGEEFTTEEIVAPEVFAEEIPEIAEPAPEYIPEDETEDEEEPEEYEEETRPEETFYVVEKKEKKPKKKSAAPALILVLCAMLAVGGYYVVKDMSSEGVNPEEVETFEENVQPEVNVAPESSEGITEEVPVFDEPVATPVESLEDEPEVAEKPEEKPAVAPAEKPAQKPVQKPAQKPAQKPVEKPAEEKQPEAEKPAIAYRIRIAADDSKSQIGAFADLERAKNFAAQHAADGYKVFDMSGNLVYAP